VDREKLRARQSPLKQRYGADPAAARTKVGARASFADPGITCTVTTWAGEVRAGLHTATGGDGSDACSADMLLQALLGCMGVTLRSVATAMRIDIRGATLAATGFFDARGTLGLSREVPIGTTDIAVIAELDTDASDAQLTRLAELTERYCVVGQTLDPRPTLAVVRTGVTA
jgi:uncharacterized OsmC-like protein